MNLNTIASAPGAKKARRRVGRGIGSGLGKTAGRGHKGQKSRSGGYHKVGFQGGQMPLQRRLPKRAFKSTQAGLVAEITLRQLDALTQVDVTLQVLRECKIISRHAEKVKVIKSGELTRSVRLKGISATAQARQAIQSAGGSIDA